MEQGIFTSDNKRWTLLVEAGKIRSEAADQGYSRAEEIIKDFLAFEKQREMSLSLIPYRGTNNCWIVAPVMSGYGGNYVILVPNDVTAYRLADGFTDSPATFETYFMRRIADYIRPSCG